jgi:superfamily II DNA or RNA helicase
VNPGLYRFPAGLTEKVADELGLTWTKGDHRFSKVRKSYPNARFSMRPYQTQAIMSLLRTDTPRSGGVLQAATGAGKTLMAAKLIHSTGKCTLVLTHTKDLLRQTADELFSLARRTRRDIRRRQEADGPVGNGRHGSSRCSGGRRPAAPC